MTVSIMIYMIKFDESTQDFEWLWKILDFATMENTWLWKILDFATMVKLNKN